MKTSEKIKDYLITTKHLQGEHPQKRHGNKNAMEPVSLEQFRKSKTIDLFETKTCSRCSGSGSYSFNLRHGTMCYGCQGTGKKFTPRGVKQSELYKKLKSKLASDVVVGDTVVTPDRTSFKVTSIGSRITKWLENGIEKTMPVIVLKGDGYSDEVPPNSSVVVKRPIEELYQFYLDALQI